MLDPVLLALLAMLRRAWEQGVATHALLDLGHTDLARLLALDAVVHRSADGRLGTMGEESGSVNGAACGEALIGHPALDACRLMEFSPDLREVISRVWSEAWLEHRPDSQPLDALDVARRASHLHNAVKYQEFLDNIEQSERIYHLGDPEGELRAALRLVNP